MRRNIVSFAQSLLILTILFGLLFAVDGIVTPNSGLNVEVDDTTWEPDIFSLKVDDLTWFRGSVPPTVHGTRPKLHSFHKTQGSDKWGEYSKLEWAWSDEEDASDDAVFVSTDFRVYRDDELVIFTQTWPQGFQNNPNSSYSSPFIASFPSFNVTDRRDKQDLSYLGWGGCMASQTMSGPWGGCSFPTFDGATSGVPLLWHDSKGRSLVMSPMNNFFVGGQALNLTSSPWLECGIRSTVHTLPAGFSHSTILVGGHGINNTMFAWGDHLLSISGKKRTDPSHDFVLSHLGYWTDNGAYYYHLQTIPGFDNEEEALNAVKADLLDRKIPVRYFQWDDWWMQSKGDVPGMTSWTPLPSVFPSGFTDWLGEPLSLYAPMYAKENAWAKDYTWKVDENKGESAIPLDPRFYKDLFSNGTKIGMKMFEQDFLCTTNSHTSLTNSDVYSGMAWARHMDEAAAATGVTLQWCMMNACHALQSTLVHSMTNGRATDDNTRQNPYNIASMGQNGLLFYALGFFPSRDNVWTTAPDVEQAGCSRRCVEPNALVDNAVALLSGGPYGPADAVGFTDYSVVMRAVRSDGVLLRPSWPLSSLDATFLKRGRDAHLPLVWAAHDDFAGVGRWSYIVGINLIEPFSLTPRDLQQQMSPKGPTNNDVVAIAWPVNLSTGYEEGLEVTSISSSKPLEIPAAPTKDNVPGASLWATAPVLPNGMALLGEVSKWATMSTRRFQDVHMADSILSCTVSGAPGEKAAISYVPPYSSSKAETTVCDFSSDSVTCSPEDKHGDTDCRMILTCTADECTCTGRGITEQAMNFLRNIK